MGDNSTSETNSSSVGSSGDEEDDVEVAAEADEEGNFRG